MGWGEVINGGFGMVLDGSDDAERKCKDFLHWDVCNGVSRRSWAGNENAIMTIKEEMEREAQLKVTMPSFADKDLLDQVLSAVGRGSSQRDGFSQFDLLLTNCKIATMSSESTVGEECGVIDNGCIGITDGKFAFIGVSSVGKYGKVTKDLGGKLVTPGE